jgi:hypothetical protein
VATPQSTLQATQPLPSRSSAAMKEAIGLLHLVKRGEKVEDIRKLIGTSTPQRRKTLVMFDELCLRNGFARIRRTAQPVEPTPCPNSLPRLAQESSRAAHKTGPGRRFTQTEIEGIKAAIRAGKRSGEIRAAFHCTLDPLLRIRRAMGVYKDCRRKPSITDDVRAQIIKLLPNHSVRKIQAMLNLSQRRVRAVANGVGGAVLYKSPGPGRRISSQLRQEILAALQAGMLQKEIKEKFMVSAWTVVRLRSELGDVCGRRHKLTAVQVEEIRAALAAHTMTWKAVAQKYGVGLTTIGSVFRGEKGYTHNDSETGTADREKVKDICAEQSGHQTASDR